jgi:hypothetical protein
VVQVMEMMEMMEMMENSSLASNPSSTHQQHPMHQSPTCPPLSGSKESQEATIEQLAAEHSIDLLVLARYMQIFTQAFCERNWQRTINIHHSFLPAFEGARPYHRAHERGVKIIGATAHYATSDLDAGPIIEQGITRITHRWVWGWVAGTSFALTRWCWCHDFVVLALGDAGDAHMRQVLAAACHDVQGCWLRAHLSGMASCSCMHGIGRVPPGGNRTVPLCMVCIH